MFRAVKEKPQTVVYGLDSIAKFLFERATDIINGTTAVAKAPDRRSDIVEMQRYGLVLDESGEYPTNPIISETRNEDFDRPVVPVTKLALLLGNHIEQIYLTFGHIDTAAGNTLAPRPLV